MKQFYVIFSDIKVSTLWTQLTWSHIRQLFSLDYILELDNKKVIDISKYNKNEAKLIRDLIAYIDSNK